MLDLPAILALGRDAGLGACGIASCAPSESAGALDAWLVRGAHGSMQWMADTAEIRKQVTRYWPFAKSALVATLSYHLEPKQRAQLPGLARHIARYARGADYHELMRARLGAWVEAIADLRGAPFRYAVVCDHSAILEREMAVRAGLGWIGKNSCLIGPEGNSWLVIGLILTEFPVTEFGLAETQANARSLDRCGSCTACLDVCPTAAIPEPYFVNASHCISYLTIEHRGPFPEPLAAKSGDWFFGCDLCQEVCPWNRRPAADGDPFFRPLPRYEQLTLAEVARFDIPSFRAAFAGTPLLRPKRAGTVRNALLAGYHAGDRETIDAARALIDDEEVPVRETARWVVANRR